MKLIIDIQDFVYNNVKEFDTTHNYELNIVESIKNGIPLSEELEKIKAETLKLFCDTCAYGNRCNGSDELPKCSHQHEFEEEFEELICNHISELKGEQE